MTTAICAFRRDKRRRSAKTTEDASTAYPAASAVHFHEPSENSDADELVIKSPQVTEATTAQTEATAVAVTKSRRKMTKEKKDALIAAAPARGLAPMSSEVVLTKGNGADAKYAKALPLGATLIFSFQTELRFTMHSHSSFVKSTSR